MVKRSMQEIGSPRMPSKRWPHLQKKAEELTSRHSDFNAFCVSMNPSVQRYAAENTERAFFGSAPMLCTIDAAYGEGSAAQWLIPQLFDLCATAGVNVKLDDVQ